MLYYTFDVMNEYLQQLNIWLLAHNFGRFQYNI